MSITPTPRSAKVGSGEAAAARELAKADIPVELMIVSPNGGDANGLRVLNYLKAHFGASDEQKSAWYRHWVTDGLLACEKLLADHADTGDFCHGDAPQNQPDAT